VTHTVAVLDYGSGNLRSAERALRRVGADVTVTADPKLAAAADGLVIPGVGAFAACMQGLLAVGGARIVSDRLRRERPMLGICVGMQVLFELGVEHGHRTDGLGVLPGRVEKLDAPVLPHMGWNTVHPPRGSKLFAGVDAETRFYFVHSYGVRSTAGLSGTTRVTISEHGREFVSAVESGVVSATQFHPEKSGDAGAALLENWLTTL
jgi:glutamine amidotransferase